MASEFRDRMQRLREVAGRRAVGIRRRSEWLDRRRCERAERGDLAAGAEPAPEQPPEGG